jgi:hypothetical protein
MSAEKREIPGITMIQVNCDVHCFHNEQDADAVFHCGSAQAMVWLQWEVDGLPRFCIGRLRELDEDSDPSLADDGLFRYDEAPHVMAVYRKAVEFIYRELPDVQRPDWLGC